MTDGRPEPPEPPGGWVDLPDATVPTPASAPGTPPPPRGRRGLVVLAAVVVLVLVGGAVAFLVGRGGDGEEASTEEPSGAEVDEDDDEGIDPPDEWDARILPLVEYVEEERGLEFDHPVEVEYLDEAEWKEQAELDEELTEEDVALLENGEGLFRAIGLAEGELDLLESYEEIGASGTLGHYDSEDQIIRIRGEDLTPEVNAVLVHEITHALQDQHFDIGDRLEAVSEEDTDEESFRVLVEGDADRIEDRWVEALPDDEQQELEGQQAATSEEALASLAELPSSLVTFFASSYILGEGFMAMLEADGGDEAIDDAFDSPPGPDEHVFDPITYLQADAETEVDLPDVDGEPIKDLDGAFGAMSWYLMLAERIDPVTALGALDEWGGDSFIAYEDGSRTCAAMRFIGETSAGAGKMEDALVEWADNMPDAAAVQVSRDGDEVDVVTCDPGPEADLLEGQGRSQETISLVATRTSLAANVLEGGGSEDEATCFSRGLIANLPYELLVSSETTAEQDATIQEVAQEQVQACR